MDKINMAGGRDTGEVTEWIDWTDWTDRTDRTDWTDWGAVPMPGMHGGQDRVSTWR